MHGSSPRRRMEGRGGAAPDQSGRSAPLWRIPYSRLPCAATYPRFQVGVNHTSFIVTLGGSVAT